MRRSLLQMTLILCGILVLQTTVLNWIEFWGVKPNLLLLFFVFLAIYHGSMPSLFCGFFTGLCVDVVLTQPVGYYAFAYTLCGYIFGLGKGKIFFDPILMPLIIALLASFYMQSCLFVLSSIFHLERPLSFFFNNSFLIELLYSLAVSPFVLLIFTLCRKKFHHRRGLSG